MTTINIDWLRNEISEAEKKVGFNSTSLTQRINESRLLTLKSVLEVCKEEENNGWIRIEEDGSNLPDKFCECRVILKSRPDNSFSLMYAPDDKSFENDMAYFKASEISHYYIPFNEEKLPIY